MPYKNIILVMCIVALIVTGLSLNKIWPGIRASEIPENTDQAQSQSLQPPKAPEASAIQNTIPADLPVPNDSARKPVRLTIPSLNVDAPVIEVGLTSSGKMDVPNNFVQLGWYSPGVMPGNTGSAVIDGHVDNGGFNPTIDGVFKHLKDLKTGSDLFTTSQNGTKIHFKVISVVSYRTDQFPADLVFNQNDGSYLKLITCNGKWNPATKTYDERIVVTAFLA